MASFLSSSSYKRPRTDTPFAFTLKFVQTSSIERPVSLLTPLEDLRHDINFGEYKMSKHATLSVEERNETGKGAARRARRAGLVPAVIYGDNKAPQTINLKFNELLKSLKKGRFLSTLHDLEVGGQKVTVIPRDVQRDVVRDLPTHVDFLRLSESSRIKLFIHVEFINEDKCPGLRRGGVLNITRHDVELDVRAGAIPEKLVADLEGLKIGDTIHISNIVMPEGAKPVISDRDFAIATLQAPSALLSSDDEDETPETEVTGQKNTGKEDE